MSLAAAGGRRAWSRTKSDVSKLVVHGVPVRNGREENEKDRKQWVRCTRRGGYWSGDGGIVNTHDMVVALCDRMVVAILSESQRHKDHSAVVDCPGGPRVGQERGIVCGWRTTELRKVGGDVAYTVIHQNLFVFFSENRHRIDRGWRH